MKRSIPSPSISTFIYLLSHYNNRTVTRASAPRWRKINCFFYIFRTIISKVQSWIKGAAGGMRCTIPDARGNKIQRPELLSYTKDSVRIWAFISKHVQLAHTIMVLQQHRTLVSSLCIVHAPSRSSPQNEKTSCLLYGDVCLLAHERVRQPKTIL